MVDGTIENMLGNILNDRGGTNTQVIAGPWHKMLSTISFVFLGDLTLKPDFSAALYFQEDSFLAATVYFLVAGQSWPWTLQKCKN